MFYSLKAWFQEKITSACLFILTTTNKHKNRCLADKLHTLVCFYDPEESMLKIPGVIVCDTASFCRVCNPGLSEAQADSFAELPKKSDLPPEIQKKLDADFGKMPLDNVLECIAQYCNDFCKKAPPGGYPTIPEKCNYTACPLHPYRLGSGEIT